MCLTADNLLVLQQEEVCCQAASLRLEGASNALAGQTKHRQADDQQTDPCVAISHATNTKGSNCMLQNKQHSAGKHVCHRAYGDDTNTSEKGKDVCFRKGTINF